MYRSRITVSATAWFALVLLISSVSPAQRQTESQRERKPKEQAAAVENATRIVPLDRFAAGDH